MDARDRLNVERTDLRQIALHDPLVAVADPEDVVAGQARADRGGADHAVDTRGGTAADQNRDLLLFRHGGQSALYQSFSALTPPTGLTFFAGGALRQTGRPS